MASNYFEAATKVDTEWDGLVQALVQQVRVDWTTGETDVPDIDTFEQVVREQMPEANADGIVRLHALLWDGFAVPPGSPSPEDPSFRIVPWRVIASEDYGPTLRQEDWDWLGVRGDAGPEDVGAALRRFPSLPKYLNDPRYFEPISGAAALHARARADWEVLRDQSDTIAALSAAGGAELRGQRSRPDLAVSRFLPLGFGFQSPARPADTGTTTQALGSAPPQPAPGPDYAKLATLVAGFVQQIGVCFEQATWSVWWSNGPWSFPNNLWTAPIGVRICLNKACGDKLKDQLGALASGVGGLGLAAIIAQVAAGAGFAQILSAAFGVLGWVGIACLEFAVYWLLQIANNIGTNGVCILHLFPWIIGVEGIYKGRAYPLN
jgi:hypothetical protein